MSQDPVRKQALETASTAPASAPEPWTDRDIAMRERADASASTAPTGDASPSVAAPTPADIVLIDDIARQIESRLGDDARELTVTVVDAEVTLEGPVREQAAKDVVGAIVDACPGVRAVDNRLLVDWVDGTPSAERAATSAPPPPEADYLKSADGSPTTAQRRTEK